MLSVSADNVTQMWGDARVVRVRVPPVRSLLRRTLKRFLRLLPSLILLAFVLSLIFVTLMQIAVLHAHRRAMLTKRETSPAPVVATRPSVPSAASQISEPASTPKSKHPDVVRIEALLNRTAPSIETNTRLLQQFVNTARLRQILQQAQDLVREQHRTVFVSSCRTSECSIVAETTGLPVAFLADPEDDMNRVVVNISHEDKFSANVVSCASTENDTASYSGLSSKKLGCPSVPPGLIGKLDINLTTSAKKTFQDVLKSNAALRPGGAWSPTCCTSRHRVAIIIPYRDREEHLAVLLYYLHPILQRQLLDYRIYIVEQNGNDTFNKGVLMNAGVREALREFDFHCFVFHDVDLIPEDDRNMYSCPPSPRHMSVAIDKFNYRLPYTLLVGGVFSIRKEHLVQVNGYSNLYWGWGGEDDDMAYRIRYRNLNIIRPPTEVARYKMIKHDHRQESPNNIRRALLRMAKRRSEKDGLSSVKYTLISKVKSPLFTHITVDIGNNHKWQFAYGNKLILNF